MKRKKHIRRILVLLVVCLLVWTVFPRSFSWLIPQRVVDGGKEIQSETEWIASSSFGMDQASLDAFSDLQNEMAPFHFLADPTTLILFLHQPREPVKVKIDYFQEGGSSTGHCGTTLLWDGQILWVNWLGSHYLGYWPTSQPDMDAAMQQLAEQYGS